MIGKATRFKNKKSSTIQRARSNMKHRLLNRKPRTTVFHASRKYVTSLHKKIADRVLSMAEAIASSTFVATGSATSVLALHETCSGFLCKMKDSVSDSVTQLQTQNLTDKKARRMLYSFFQLFVDAVESCSILKPTIPVCETCSLFLETYSDAISDTSINVAASEEDLQKATDSSVRSFMDLFADACSSTHQQLETKLSEDCVRLIKYCQAVVPYVTKDIHATPVRSKQDTSFLFEKIISAFNAFVLLSSTTLQLPPRMYFKMDKLIQFTMPAPKLMLAVDSLIKMKSDRLKMACLRLKPANSDRSLPSVSMSSKPSDTQYHTSLEDGFATPTTSSFEDICRDLFGVFDDVESTTGAVRITQITSELAIPEPIPAQKAVSYHAPEEACSVSFANYIKQMESHKVALSFTILAMESLEKIIKEQNERIKLLEGWMM